jgi:hypothetical protein
MILDNFKEGVICLDSRFEWYCKHNLSIRFLGNEAKNQKKEYS